MSHRICRLRRLFGRLAIGTAIDYARVEVDVSQKAVEVLIGKLLTDDAFRHQFYRDPSGAFQVMDFMGLKLTAIERASLLTLDAQRCARFARRIDVRIRKASDVTAGTRTKK